MCSELNINQVMSTPRCSTPTSPLLKTVTLTDTNRHDWAIVDYGASSHFLTTAAPFNNMQPATTPIRAKLPNGNTICTTHTCTLLLDHLPEKAWHAHVLPHLATHSLISIVNLCNAGCKVIFNKIRCTINHRGKTII